MSSITPKTSLTLTIGGAAMAVVALVGTGWRAANAVRDLRDEVAALRRDVAASVQDRWTAADMERWAYQLERVNREVRLNVPDVRKAKIEITRTP